MLTVKAIRNTAKTLGVRRACARMQKAGLPLVVALAWIAGMSAVRRYYERESNVRTYNEI